MSNNNSAPGFPPPPPPPAGMSSGTKVLLGVGCFLMACVVICCGGVAMLGMRVSKQVQQFGNGLAITDPAEVMQVAREMADTDLLDDFTGESASEIKLPFVNKLVFKVAKLKAADDRSMLLCEWSRDAIAGKSHDELIRETTDMAAAKQGKPDDEAKTSPEPPQLDVQIKEIKVRDQPARFQFAKVKHKPAGGVEAEYWQVSGVFEGKEGPTVLTLFLPRTDYTMEQLIADFEAIK